jgi:polyisoprenoid-binding protein YceI
MFWYIDPAHSQVNFSVKHMMVSTVRGRLGKVSGKLDLDPQRPEKADFEVSVDVASIDTNDERRDGHLRSGDFFDAATHPAITFKSNAIFAKGNGHYTASGDLTIRGTTRPISFEIELTGIAGDAMGATKLGATATTSIDRTDFGLVWNMPVPNGVLVGEKVKIEVDLEAYDESSAKKVGLAA